MKSKKTILLYILIGLFLIGSAFQIINNRSYYKMEKVSFYNLDKEELNARYYDGDKDKGVIIVNDLEDNMKDASIMAGEFTKLGYNVYIFDLPSQGLSKGSIEFGYKQNEYIAEQYYNALVAFSQLAKINQENIHIIASGAGARAVLQTATKQIFTPKDITLIGTKSNILKKLDFDVINFVKEEDIGFMKKLSAKNPGLNIHLITSNLSSDSSVKENEALKEKLEADATGSADENKVTFDIAKFAFPTNLIANGKVVESTVDYIAKADGESYSPSPLLPIKGYTSFILSIIALAIVILCYRLTNNEYYENKGQVKFSKEFIIWKLIAIVPAYIMVFVLPVIIYFALSSLIPIPYFELVTLSLLSSYGLLLYYLYKKTDFAGDLGNYIFYKETKKNISGGLIVTGLLVIIIGLLSVSGNNIIFPIFSYKTIWLVLFGILCSFLFFIEEREKEVVIATQSERYIMSAFNFIIYLIVAFALLLLGQISSSIKFFVLSYYIILFLAAGKLMKVINSPTWLNALVQSFLVCFIVLSNTVLFF